MKSSPHTTIVLFGATGDLVSRKVLPALYELELEKKPVADSIIPFTRRDLTTEEFLLQFVRPAVEKVFGGVDEKIYKRFAGRFKYVRGDYTKKESFVRLARVLAEHNIYVPKNELFYLPIYPEHLKDVVRFMNDAGVVEDPRDDEHGWERIVVEKPFGESRVSAEELFTALRTIFAEDEIYCLDHYLGKPMLQNISTLKREHEALRGITLKSHIEKIHIRIFEAKGVEERGAFFDGVGAFLDVGQNHALEMFALVFSALFSGDTNLTREEALKKLRTLLPAEVEEQTIRAQYHGYRDIRNVRENSTTETYFKVESSVEDTVHKGKIAVVLEGGKGLGEENRKEIEVEFKKDGVRKSVRFRFEPKEEVELETFGKDARLKTFPVRDQSDRKQYTEEYKTLFRAVVSSDRDERFFLFPSEVLLLWRFADPIVESWKKGHMPLLGYSKNTLPGLY